MVSNNFERERERHLEPIKMTIESRVPSKWRFLDLETGDIWQWNEQKDDFSRSKDLPNSHQVLASVNVCLPLSNPKEDIQQIVESLRDCLELLDKQREEYNNSLSLLPRKPVGRGKVAQKAFEALALYREVKDG
jgi:hypothetical protein